MVLYIIIAIGLITFIVLAILFFLLSKEGQRKDDEKAVPLKDLNELKNDIPPSPLQVTNEIKGSSGEDDINKKRVQELEDELRTIKQKSEEQADATREMIITLNKENMSLKSQQADQQEALQKLAIVQTQMESTNAKVQQLEDEKVALKVQMDVEIARAKAAVTEVPQPVPDDSLRQEMETLKSEQTQSKQLNAQLTQKNDALQYELVKAKAQASGLERVNFNYTNQMEDLLKKINAAQATIDNLSQANIQLEGTLEGVNQKNEELVKKDQLTQFELEKNRSRLLVLERDYEDLKARQNQS